MKKISKKNDVFNIVEFVSSKLEELKAYDIQIIDFKNKNLLFKKAVIATGSSSRHVINLANKLCDLLKREYNIFAKSEGYYHGEWILIDVNGIMINIFQEKIRDKYKLEEMWKE